MQVKKGRTGKNPPANGSKKNATVAKSEIERRLRQAGKIRFKLATRPDFGLQSNFSISFVAMHSATSILWSAS